MHHSSACPTLKEMISRKKQMEHLFLLMLTFEFNSSFVIPVVLLTCSPAFFPLSYFGCQSKDFHHKLAQFRVLFEKFKLNRDKNRKKLDTPYDNK